MKHKKHVLYFFFSFLYVLCVFYSISIIKWKDDNLMYLNIYENIIKNPMPFGSEFVLSFLMWCCKYLGVTYTGFIFILQMAWLPLVISFERYVNAGTKKYFFSLVFLVCFLYVPFHESMIYLARQTLSVYIFFVAVTISNKYLRILCAILMIVSHTSSFALLPLLFGFGMSFLLSRFFLFLIFICFVFSVFFQFDFSILFLQWLIGVDIIPEFFKYNFDAKLGFYLSGKYLPSLDVKNSIVSTIAIFITLLFIFLFYKKERFSLKLNIVLSAFVISSFFYFLFFNNPILANRMGFLAYFFIAPFVGFSFCILLKEKINKLYFVLVRHNE